jgi:hypothetical protein
MPPKNLRRRDGRSLAREQRRWQPKTSSRHGMQFCIIHRPLSVSHTNYLTLASELPHL